MTTLDDIEADVNSKVTTQTTGDNTALRVRTALINLATQILDDVAAQNTTITTGIASATTAANAAKAVAASASRAAAPAFDLLGSMAFRIGQGAFGLQNMRPLAPGGVADTQIDTGTGIPGSSGSVVGWMASPFIAVVPGSTLTVKLRATSGLASAPNQPFLFYDASRAFLSAEVGGYPSGGAWTDGATITVPSTAYFIRTHTDAHNADRLALWASTPPSFLTHPWQVMASSVSMHRPWTGRTWMLCGDSMGASRSGNSWFSDVAKYHGCKQVRNQAVDGGTTTTMMQKYNRPTDFSRVNLVAGDFTNVDAVITQVGVNDLSISTAIGTINDAPTASTFYGQYIKFIELVLASNPYLKLILSPPSGKHYPGGPGGANRTGDGLYATRSPWQGTSGDAADIETNIQPYRDAVYSLCDRYALSCWDVPAHSQMSYFTALAYSDEGLHPSYSGERWTDGNPAHQAVGKNYGSKIVFGSSLAAFMHTVFPSDWYGDPWIGESDLTYNPEQI
jgi:hypothetical protein